MEIDQIRKLVNEYQGEVCYFDNMIDFSKTPNEKAYYQNLKDKKSYELIDQIVNILKQDQ